MSDDTRKTAYLSLSETINEASLNNQSLSKEMVASSATAYVDLTTSLEDKPDLAKNTTLLRGSAMAI